MRTEEEIRKKIEGVRNTINRKDVSFTYGAAYIYALQWVLGEE
jgi:hypothetical protein